MLIYDIETNGLLDELDVIHTLHILDKKTGKRTRYNAGFFADGSPAPRDGSIEEGIAILEEADEICGHNVINFDNPAIAKLFKGFRPKGKVHDTLIAARYIWPHIRDIDQRMLLKKKYPPEFTGKLIGSHSLKAWGFRLGVLKRDYEGEWHSFTQEMESYAEQDPVTTEALWDKIVSKAPSQDALDLEYETARIIAMQERFGFRFNDAAADGLERVLRMQRAEVYDKLLAAFPPWFEPERKGGKPVEFIPKRDNKKLGYIAGVPVTKTKLISFNPASRDHIAGRLKELYDWSPVEFTPSGKPQVDETTLAALDHIPEAALLVEFLTIEKRLGQLADGKQAWRKVVGPDGRIHGRVNTLGAITRRMTHSNPNIAQVPSIVNAKGPVPFGAECRELFEVAPGNKLVGVDAEGLELRMLAHYMAKYDGGAYGDTVVNGKKEDGTDVHTVNQRLIKLNSRNSAKTWIYAYLYGAGLLKLGTVIYEDMTPKQREAFNAKHPAGPKREQALARLGKRARVRVEEGLPALGKLQQKVQKLAKRGFLPALDGGDLIVRSAHAALNTLLQGNGAIVMKKALVILDERLQAQGWVPDLFTGRYHRGDEVMGFTANVHDEFQMEAPEGFAEELGQMGKDAIRDAGVALGCRCELAGSCDIGNNWKETH